MSIREMGIGEERGWVGNGEGAGVGASCTRGL